MEMSMATPQNSSTAGREKGERTLIDDDVYERHERTLIGMPCVISALMMMMMFITIFAED